MTTSELNQQYERLKPEGLFFSELLTLENPILYKIAVLAIYTVNPPNSASLVNKNLIN